MRDKDKIEKEQELQEKEAIMYMLSEIDSAIPQNSPYRGSYEQVKEFFDNNHELTDKHRKLLQRLYEKVTSIDNY